ncbi:MAG: hypothetical protein RL391_1486 [Actinomycetota bacterium]|jgi:decaprenylphospho-beta-D-erythro-pentofuranosid-2-ulose 2-reductase
MHNAMGEPQNILVLGGTSEIGVAIARRLMAPMTKRVTLACRRPEEAALAVASLARPGVVVEAVNFEAVNVSGHTEFVRDVVDRTGDLDVVVLAFGQLGDQERLEGDPASAADLINVNFSAAASVSLAVVAQLKAQGHGRLVVLSSVAGERVRKSNFVYGASKAGLDGFAQGLSDSLVGSGAGVLIVRPGFVHSNMTAGLKPAPFATSPDVVAEAVVKGLKSNRRIVWAPSILRWVFMILRHVPAPLWQRLPLG